MEGTIRETIDIRETETVIDLPMGSRVVQIHNRSGERETNTVTVRGGATVFALFTYEPSFKIGDQGPADGIVFYDKGDDSGGCRYLEAWAQDKTGRY